MPLKGGTQLKKDCGMWINILSHEIKKRMNANMLELGLTGVQSRVLHYILVKCADGPVFQRDVESAFSLSRSTATGILQLMEKNGLILRESVASDARLKNLIPTEKAAKLDAADRREPPPDGAGNSPAACPTHRLHFFKKTPRVCTPIWLNSALSGSQCPATSFSRSAYGIYRRRRGLEECRL